MGSLMAYGKTVFRAPMHCSVNSVSELRELCGKTVRKSLFGPNGGTTFVSSGSKIEHGVRWFRHRFRRRGLTRRPDRNRCRQAGT